MSVSSPHSVLDDLNGLREEAAEAHNRYHDWKKVPYWDCPLSPCSWFNNDLPLIETQIRSLFEQLEGTVSRDSALALIEDANRWGKAYRETRDELAGLKEQYETLRGEVRRAQASLALEFYAGSRGKTAEILRAALNPAIRPEASEGAGPRPQGPLTSGNPSVGPTPSETSDPASEPEAE